MHRVGGSNSSSTRDSRSARSRSRRRRSVSPSARDRRRRRSRSSSRRRPARHSPAPRSARRRHSLDRHSHSPGRRSPNQHFKDSVKTSTRLGLPVDSLRDFNRDNLAHDAASSRHFSLPKSLNPYPLDEDHRFSHDGDYRQSDYVVKYNHLAHLYRQQETDLNGDPLKESSNSSKDRRQEHKHLNYDRNDRLLDGTVDQNDFVPGIQKYCKQNFSRSPSPVDFHELKLDKRKREEVHRNLTQELPGNSYRLPGQAKPVWPSESHRIYTPDEVPQIPKKSILKKRVGDSSVQPCSTDNSLDAENFLKEFSTCSGIESAASNKSDIPVHDRQPHSRYQQNSDNFLKQNKDCESTFEPADQQSDFLLPHERASQDGNGFSCILGTMTDSTSAQEKRRHNEDKEKIVYDYGHKNDSHINSCCAQKITLAVEEETMKQKVTSLSLPGSYVKTDTSEKSQPEYEKIHDLLKTIGLDIGVDEIGKLAARTQERLHGKNTSRSPDRHMVASHKSKSRKKHQSRSDTDSPEPVRKYSLSPGSSSPSKDISDDNKRKTVGQDNSFGTKPALPSAITCLPNLSPFTSLSWYSFPYFTPFGAAQLPQNYTVPTIPPGFIPYGPYVTYGAPGWPMYAQQGDPALSALHAYHTAMMPAYYSQPKLKAIEEISADKEVLCSEFNDSVHEEIPDTAPNSKLPSHLSPLALKSAKERLSDEQNRISQRQKTRCPGRNLKGKTRCSLKWSTSETVFRWRLLTWKSKSMLQKRKNVSLTR
ncbi:zinc finger protein 318 isoform X2 [Anolis carolinensis]|uniref:zinc finger protein 318 isoform X2 n=1 Tax=Anolis carolinensis TaxID=28377 RepID=UPI000462C072|nr:PREDICTED: zinc finger protein 318 isoform X2 [Anolis carolinensis]|eukprot:XP_008123591.1 PREDICTED: zinc finger protein 318 isoform X2 [Anolis carolinensis]